MTQLVQQVLDRRKELDEKTSAIRRKLQTYPDGKLICTRNGRYIKWYHSDGRIQTYIPKKKREYVVLDIIENFTYEKWVSLPNRLVIQIVQC